MAFATLGFGTATISSTTAGPGETPSVTITDTGSFTSTAYLLITPRNIVTDVTGDIALYWDRVDDDNVEIKASRQLPADEEIVFDWHAFDDSGA